MSCLLIQKTPLSAEAEDSTVATEHNFNPGNHAEASNDEDGFENGSIQYHKVICCYVISIFSITSYSFLF